MKNARPHSDDEGSATLSTPETAVLNSREERDLFRALGECKQKLADALARIEGAEVPEESDDPRTRAHDIANFYRNDPPNEARLGAIFRRYSELRGRLALANMRLVAHMAKRFRNRGIAYSDLIQEGFCGLLEAIDRFDLTRETKLSTYAVWWIRQSMQRALAAGAYPVRLSPRHLRQLAQNQAKIERAEWSSPAPTSGSAASTEMIHQIHAATRPTVSLDAAFDSHADSHFTLLQAMTDREDDSIAQVDHQETMSLLLQALRPREQQVLSLRFGLSGGPRLSLSQVGKVLEVSKERVRQIQDRALEKLREASGEERLTDLLGPDR